MREGEVSGEEKGVRRKGRLCVIDLRGMDATGTQNVHLTITNVIYTPPLHCQCDKLLQIIQGSHSSFSCRSAQKCSPQTVNDNFSSHEVETQAHFCKISSKRH